MSKSILANQQALLTQELNRFQDFLSVDGWQRLLLNGTAAFGLVKNPLDSAFSNLKVTADALPNFIDVAAGLAIDSGANVITCLAQTLAVTNDSNWYWLKVAYAEIKTEVGTLNIDSDGNMTGSGTLFESVLRPGGKIPFQITFPNAVSNTGIYEVQTVTSDTQAQISVLAGSLTPENNLTYYVIGSFTPGYVIPTPDLGIYRYDSSTLTLVPEVTPNTAPAKTAGLEFWLARVQNTGGVLVVQDKRTEIWETTADFNLADYTTAPNPLVGVESIKFDSPLTPQERNIVDFAWCFRSSNWTINTNLYQLTLNAGLGGVFKATTDFTNGDFDGWRAYTPNGNYARVISSIKSGTQINLQLDRLNPDDFNNTLTGAGTITTALGTTVVGSGTDFLNQAVIGDLITISGQTRTIVGITDATHIVIDPSVPWIGTISGVYTITTPFEILICPDAEAIEVWFIRTNPTVSGTGTVNASGTAVTGTATLFSTEVQLGDVLNIAGQKRVVTVITNDLNIIVDTAWSGNPTGTYTITHLVQEPVQGEANYEFPINQRLAHISQLVFATPTCIYSVRYCYRNVRGYSEFAELPNGIYYNESAFDASGLLVNPGNTTNYAAVKFPIGNIILTSASTAYTNFNLGDNLGLAYVPISNGTPFHNFVVGQDKQIQVFQGSDTITGTYTIGLKTTGVKLKNGNKFLIDIDGHFDLAPGIYVEIRQDATGAGVGGTLLRAYALDEFQQSYWGIGGNTPQTQGRNNARVEIECVFDGTNWHVSTLKKDNSLSQTFVGMYAATDIPVASLPRNWVIADGTNGTIDMRRKTLFGADPADEPPNPATAFTVGTTGGSAKIEKRHLPPHRHLISVLSVDNWSSAIAAIKTWWETNITGFFNSTGTQITGGVGDGAGGSGHVNANEANTGDGTNNYNSQDALQATPDDYLPPYGALYVVKRIY